MKIGQVAALSGFPIKTIRYYEDIGLLFPSLERSDSGYRLFEESVLSRLDFISTLVGDPRCHASAASGGKPINVAVLKMIYYYKK